MVRLYSTLHRKIVELDTREPGKVGLYYCGATVQGEPHLGHAFSGVVFDTMARYLAWRGYEVTLVRNVTDIDDKIIAKANEAGVPTEEHATAMEELFNEMYTAMGVRVPDEEPHATAHVGEMHEMIAGLIQSGHAYESQGDVYFSVRSDDDYGKLSGRDLDDMRAGARVEVSGLKTDPLDFALWKAAKPGEPSWDSPWGPGRPGWHIECSAMATRYLGNDFEIHGGGSDLIFPHHENEIAQSETASGKPFARYWLHNGMVTLGGMKMSKSIGNVINVDEALRRHGGRVLRLLFLRAHYRSTLEFNWDVLEEVSTSMERIERVLADHPPTDDAPDEVVLDRFRKNMDDDFGTPGAISVLFDAIRDVNRAEDEGDEVAGLMAAIRKIVSVLGIDEAVPAGEDELAEAVAVTAIAEDLGVEPGSSIEETIEALLDRRTAARSEKDFATSDAIRDRLGEAGIVVEDTADGPRWLRG